MPRFAILPQKQFPTDAKTVNYKKVLQIGALFVNLALGVVLFVIESNQYKTLPTTINLYSMQKSASSYFNWTLPKVYTDQVCQNTDHTTYECLVKEASGTNADIEKNTFSHIQAYKMALGCYGNYSNVEAISANIALYTLTEWERALLLDSYLEKDLNPRGICSCIDEVQDAIMISSEAEWAKDARETRSKAYDGEKEKTKLKDAYDAYHPPTPPPTTTAAGANPGTTTAAAAPATTTPAPNTNRRLLSTSGENWAPSMEFYASVGLKHGTDFNDFNLRLQERINHIRSPDYPSKMPLEDARDVYKFCVANSVDRFTVKTEAAVKTDRLLMLSVVLFVLYSIHITFVLDVADFTLKDDPYSKSKAAFTRLIPLVALGAWIGVLAWADTFVISNGALIIVWALGTLAMLYHLGKKNSLSYAFYRAISTELLLVAGLYNITMHILISSNLQDLRSIQSYSFAVLALGGVYVMSYILSQYLVYEENKAYKYDPVPTYAPELGYGFVDKVYENAKMTADGARAAAVRAANTTNSQPQKIVADSTLENAADAGTIMTGALDADIVEFLPDPDKTYRNMIRHIVRLRSVLSIVLVIGIVLLTVYQWHSFAHPKPAAPQDHNQRNFQSYVWNMSMLQQGKFAFYIISLALLLLGFEVVFEVMNAGTIVSGPLGEEAQDGSQRRKNSTYDQWASKVRYNGFGNVVSRQDQPLWQNVFIALFFVTILACELILNRSMKHQLV